MGVFICLLIPTIILVCILLACKWLNFSILPKGLKLPPPQKFTFPKVKRKGYKWEEEEEDDSSSSDEDDYSDDEEWEYDSSSSEEDDL